MKNKMVLNISIAYFLMLSTILVFQVSQQEIQAIEPLPSELTVEDKLKSSVVLGINSPVSIINEKQFVIDENDSTATPIIHNGKIYIPVVLLETAYNANISYSNDTQEATVRLDNKALIFSNNSDIISVIDNISEEKVNIEAEPKILNDRFYIPLRSFADIFEKEIFYADELIIITNMQDIFDPIEEVDTIDKLNIQVQKLPIIGNKTNLKSLITNDNSKIISNSNIINKDELVFNEEGIPLETEDKEVETEDKEVETEDKESEAEDKESEAEDKEVEAEDKEVETEDKEVETEDKEVETEDIKAETEDIKAETEDIKAEAEDKEVETDDKEVETDDKEVETDDKEVELEEEEITEELPQEKMVLINETDDYNFYATKEAIKVYKRLDCVVVEEVKQEDLVNEEETDSVDDEETDSVDNEEIDSVDDEETDLVDEEETDSVDDEEITLCPEEFLFEVEKVSDNIEHILLNDKNLIISYCFDSIERGTGFTETYTITYIYDVTDTNNIQLINILENNGTFSTNLLMDNNFYNISKIDLNKDLNITPISNEYFYEDNINSSIKYNEFNLNDISYFPDKNDNYFTMVTYVDLSNPERLYTNVYFGMGNKIEIYNNNFYVATTNYDTQKSNVYLFEMLFNQELSSSKISIFEEVESIEFDNSKKIFELMTNSGLTYLDENLIEIK